MIPGVIPSCACMGVGYEDDACRAATDLTFDEAVSDDSEQDCVLAHECQTTGDPDDIAVIHACLSATAPYGPPEGADPTCLSACVATMEACANTGCDADNVLFCMRDERACERQCVP